MEFSVESKEGLERRVRIQVPAADIESEIEKRLVNVGRGARIKGFRKGKAPLKVLRQQYGQKVRQEVISDVVQTSYNEAISREQLRPAGGARIEPHSLEQGKDLEFTAVIEVYPEFEVGDAAALEVERTVATITEQDLDAMVEHLRNQRSEWREVEREARAQDRVIVSFRGTVDGGPFEGGEGQDVPVVLGGGGTIEDFEQGLTGIHAGEERVIDVRFPDDYPASGVAGKTARFEVSASRVEERHVPELDAEFFASFGVKSGGEEAFRSEVRQNMQRELERTLRAALQRSVLEALREANPVELPRALVDQEIHNMQHEAARRMGIKDHAKLPPREPFEQQARQRVALGLVLNQLIRQEEIVVDPVRVDARIDELCADYDEPEKAARYYRSNPQLKGQVEVMVLEDQVVDWLLERVRLTDVERSFAEVMNFSGAEA